VTEPSHIQLPWAYLDAGFQQRIAQLQRADELHGREHPEWQRLFHAEWVTAHPFRPQTATHCPHGHSHDAEVLGPTTHAGHAHVRRKCSVCGDEWLEPVDPVL
jgi:hypothetical protein